MWTEFKGFLTKSNALALAVGVIIGAATGKVVTGLVQDILMPLIGFVLPSGDWREAQVVLSQKTDAAGKVAVNAVKYGDFLGTILDFVLIALIVFLITKALLRPALAPPTKECPRCKETIPAEATRCRACTSDVA